MNFAFTFAATASNGIANSKAETSANLIVITSLSSSVSLRSADYPVRRCIDEPKADFLFSVVVVHPKSPDLSLALELALARCHGEDGTQVQGLVKNKADSILSYVVGKCLFAERDVGFV